MLQARADRRVTNFLVTPKYQKSGNRKNKKGHRWFFSCVPGTRAKKTFLSYDKNVDDDDKAMHRRIALHGGAGDKAISPPRRRRTLRPHRDKKKGGDRACDSARDIYSRAHPRHCKNTNPRHQDGRVIVKNTPLPLCSCQQIYALLGLPVYGTSFGLSQMKGDYKFCSIKLERKIRSARPI